MDGTFSFARHTRAMTSRAPLAIAAIGTLAVAAYAAWAAVQILVLNPLAAAPGRSLAEIHADITSAQQWSGPGQVFAILGLGVVLAVVALAGVLLFPGASATGTVAVYLALLVFGAPGYFWASFDSGMSLADTYGIGGGDHSPWALPLYAVSVLALVALVALAVAAAARRRPAAAAPRTA